MSNDNKQLFNFLPRVIEDMIYEFNVEHRPNLKNVLNELTENEPYTLICEGCEIGKIGITLYSVFPHSFICSKKCLNKFIGLIPYGCPDRNCSEEK